MVNEPPSRFPNGAPMEREARLQSLPLHILLDPQQGAPPPGFPNRAPVERDAPFTEPSFHYLSQFPVKDPLPMLPNGAPTEKDTRIQNLHPIPWKFVFPSESPVREPPPCSPTVSLWREILRLQSHWSIYSFMSARVPKKGSLLQSGDKHTATIHGASRGRKAYVQCGAAWFPNGIINVSATTSPVPCSPRHNTFYLGLGRPESR